MPLLKIQTNVQADDEQASELIRAASALLSTLLGKPETYIMVTFEHQPHMIFAADDAPLAYLELKSIGLPEDRTTDLSQRLCDLIGERLRIDPARIYIEFANAQRHLWGWNQRTF